MAYRDTKMIHFPTERRIVSIMSRVHIALIATVAFCVSLVLQVAGATGASFTKIGAILVIVSCAGAIGTTLVVVVTFPVSPRARAVSNVAAAVLLFAVTAIYGVRWLHPTENITGANDEGIYAATAVNLSRTGNYWLHASALTDLPSSFRPWIIKSDPAMANRTLRPPARFPRYHTCLFLSGGQTDRLASQFPAGFPTLLASLHSVFGLRSLRAANPLLLVFAAILTAWVTTLWLGPIAGILAYAVALWLPLDIWIGNSLYAEPLLGCLWLLTVIGFAYRDEFPITSGLLVGSSTGLSIAVKIDALPIFVITLLVLSVLALSHRRFAFVALGSIVAAGIVSVVSWLTFDPGYGRTTLASLLETNRRPLIVASAVVIVTALITALAWQKLKAWWATPLRGTVQRYVLAAGAGTALCLAAYAYFVRPDPAVPDHFYYWPQGGDIRSFREETFVRLGWYWTRSGLALATIGACLCLTQLRFTWQVLLAAVAALFLVSFCYDLRNNPIQPYGMRRLLPYGMPMLVIGATAAAPLLLRRRPSLAKATGAIIAVGLLSAFFATNDRMNRRVEYPGLEKQLAELSARLPHNSVVLTRELGPFSRLATPLEFIFQRPCVLVRTSRSSWFQGGAKQAIRQWQKSGRAVFLLVSRPDDVLELAGVQPKHFDQGTIATHMTVQSAERLRTDQSDWTLNYTVTELPPL